MSRLSFIFCLLVSLLSLAANDFDDPANSLKIEANHNLNRVKNYRSEANNNRIFDLEREKAVSEYLEEQEVWELIRERGLKEYRKLKKSSSFRDGGPEQREHNKEVLKQEKEYDQNRQSYVNAKNKVMRSSAYTYAQLEGQEYADLNSKRPRYDLRKRKKNKYVGSTKPNTGSSSGVSYNPDNYAPSAPAASDFPPPPPPPDFPQVPAPYEGYDDSIPPAYDGSAVNGVPYDPTFGGEMIPPPPPPPPDYDF